MERAQAMRGFQVMRGPQAVYGPSGGLPQQGLEAHGRSGPLKRQAVLDRGFSRFGLAQS